MGTNDQAPPEGPRFNLFEKVTEGGTVVQAVTFDEFVRHGLEVSTPGHAVKGMPWSFKFLRHHVTHETDDLYLILTDKGSRKFARGQVLIVRRDGTLDMLDGEYFRTIYRPYGKQFDGVAFAAYKVNG